MFNPFGFFPSIALLLLRIRWFISGALTGALYARNPEQFHAAAGYLLNALHAALVQLLPLIKQLAATLLAAASGEPPELDV